MFRKGNLTLIFSVILSMTLVCFVHGQVTSFPNRIVGVNVGDIIVWKSYSSPLWWYFNATVTVISGTRITLNIRENNTATGAWEDATIWNPDVSEIGTVGRYSDDTYCIIGSNLDVGDPMYYDTAPINAGNNTMYNITQVLTKTYWVVNQQVAYVTFNVGNAHGLWAYYDRKTGILCESSMGLEVVQYIPSPYGPSTGNLAVSAYYSIKQSDGSFTSTWVSIPVNISEATNVDGVNSGHTVSGTTTKDPNNPFTVSGILIGVYIVNGTYNGVTKTTQVNVYTGQTSTVAFNFGDVAPPQDETSTVIDVAIIILVSIAVLATFIYFFKYKK
jgi:hypothetical protein